MQFRSRSSHPAVVALCILLCACRHAPPQSGTQIKEGMRVDDAYGDVIELEQGWTDETQEAFYNTPQGSEIMPYPWIVALEQRDSQKPFLDPTNIERFRYLPRKKTAANPDGLPVGWTKGPDAAGREWLGLNCSACHTAQLEYTRADTQQKVGIRVDGAPTLANFNLMSEELVAALQATLAEPAKFNRFAKAVLKESSPSQNALDALRGEVQVQTEKLNTRNAINKSPVEYGFGRIDAIGFIFNNVMSIFPGIPANARPATAPASYPFLWGTDQSDVVQWTGFAANMSGAGVLVRNGGEVFGVFGKVALTKSTAYESSLQIENLGRIENWVRELNSPAWPEEVFPKIDRTKAALGEKLYADACAGCHQVIPREVAIKTAYRANITDIDILKTDPTELNNMSSRYQAGIYEGKKAASLAGDVIPNPTTGLDPLINAVTGSLLQHKLQTLAGYADQYSTWTPSHEGDAAGYKGRPLNGIWATAPYLHNGSVPNLYELLLPTGQRSKSFTLGSREFDPVRVGYALEQPKQAGAYAPFTFDVSLPGNSNAGHEFLSTQDGKPFTDEQRWQLVEYMKTL